MASLSSKTLPLPGSKSRVIDKKSTVPTSATGKFRRKVVSSENVDNDGVVRRNNNNNASAYAQPQTDVEFCEEIIV